ncbi:hypothetical protein AB0N06_39060 [Streptomyces sp. NPDC051020]
MIGTEAEAAIDQWAAEELAASPDWSASQWRRNLTLLKIEEDG